MTSDQKRSFERQWPELAQALRKILARRGVPASDLEDVIQETALRLLKIWERMDHTRPILPLATTISLNLVRDRCRRPQKEIALESAANAPDRSNVEREGMIRLDFENVARAMRGLSESHRAVLLQEVLGQPDTLDRGPNAMKMLRMRARRRLLALLETASAFVGLWVLKVRNATHDLTHTAAGAMAVVAVVAVLPTSASVVAGSSPASPMARSELNIQRAHVAAGGRRLIASGGRSSLTPQPAKTGPSDLAPAEERHPVTVPIGNGEVGAEGEFDVNDVHIEVSDRGGPVPACVEGLPSVPPDVACPED